MEGLWLLAALALALAGMVGMVLPGVPGPPLLYAGIWLAAWIDDFVHVGLIPLLLLAILAVAAYLVDLIAGSIGARRFGASRRAVSGAAIGALVGLFFGIPGLLLGPFVGAAAGEMSDRRNWRMAGRAGVGATVGFMTGVVVKLTIGTVMLAVFLVLRFV